MVTGGSVDPVPRLALRPREAARALGVCEKTLWSLTRAGRVPHLRIGTAVIYPVADLERWLAERAAEAQAKIAKKTAGAGGEHSSESPCPARLVV